MDISSLINPVADRGVEMSLETHPESGPGLALASPHQNREHPLPSASLDRSPTEDEGFIVRCCVV